jgi:pimeloyl-ACP methyl ester carboxylesterase
LSGFIDAEIVISSRIADALITAEFSPQSHHSFRCVLRKKEVLFLHMARFGTIVFTPLFLLTACTAMPAASVPTGTPAEAPCSAPGTTQWPKADAGMEIGLYLPPCYDGRATRLYPAVYLFPGFGGSNRDWFAMGAAAIADRLIGSGEVPSFIMVATGDLFDDLDGSVVADAILPYVESHYHTRAQRAWRAAAGASFGGAVAYHLAFRRPDLFASAGVFGNGAALGEEDAIRGWLAAIPATARPRVFLCTGEGDAYMLGRARALVSILDGAGIEHAEIFGAGGHTGDYWISHFDSYLRWLAADWR